MDDLEDMDDFIAVSLYGDADSHQAIVAIAMGGKTVALGGYRDALKVAVAIVQAAETARILQSELDAAPGMLVSELFDRENLRLSASDN